MKCYFFLMWGEGVGPNAYISKKNKIAEIARKKPETLKIRIKQRNFNFDNKLISSKSDFKNLRFTNNKIMKKGGSSKSYIST